MRNGITRVKGTLTILISSVASIDEERLTDNSRIGSFSLKNRRAWAAGRKATREEGRVYCLLGIFTVNISVLYGEVSKAFPRQCKLVK
jgi:hypothetical protein